LRSLRAATSSVIVVGSGLFKIAVFILVLHLGFFFICSRNAILQLLSLLEDAD
jgi:hypothetical protein